MKITAKITGLEYKSSLTSELKDFEIKDFNINNLPSSSIIKDGGFSCGISKWVSPKRTRSYPYGRIYNTLGQAKKITVIPIIKDEESAKFVAEEYARGHSFFTYISDTVDSLSSCCRLKNKIKFFGFNFSLLILLCSFQ